MKKPIITFLALALAQAAFGMPMEPFTDWETVKGHSSGAIVAQCTAAVDDPLRFNGSHGGRGLVPADIRIVSGWERDQKDQIAVRYEHGPQVWATITNLGPAVLWSFPASTRRLRKGDYYLVFANGGGGKYDAVEPYRIIPLGPYLPPDLVAGKTLDEALQSIFQYRLYSLNQELQEAQEEKQRMEAGIKK